MQSYRKRRIAILKVQGNRQEAIRELNEYLKTFISDTEAWLELSDLYLKEGDYPHAAHCIEELILSSVSLFSSFKLSTVRICWIILENSVDTSIFEFKCFSLDFLKTCRFCFLSCFRFSHIIVCICGGLRKYVTPKVVQKILNLQSRISNKLFELIHHVLAHYMG